MAYSYFLASDAPDANLVESVDLGQVGEQG